MILREDQPWATAGVGGPAQAAPPGLSAVIADAIEPAIDRLFRRSGLDLRLAEPGMLQAVKAQHARLWLELIGGDGGLDPARRTSLLDEAYRPLGLTVSDVVLSYAYVVGELLRALLHAPPETIETEPVSAAERLVRAAFLDCELSFRGEVQRLEARLKVEAARRRAAEAGRSLRS
ncbi:MAG: hypothetical protein DI570_09725 [Phenylobacterium zucineum]|nr:MAG: hypothetical protein DI570_09725 [Phenylobacterium zucineum]